MYLDGYLYEGTGLNGRSTIRKVRLDNGEVLQVQKLESQYFGEGIAVKGDTIYELTWQSEIGFLYDRATFKRKGTFSYHGEGWGLTHDGQRLIMSDGSAFLRFLDPATQKELSRMQVKDGGDAGRESQRAGVRQRRGAGQRVADTTHRPHLTEDRSRSPAGSIWMAC